MTKPTLKVIATHCTNVGVTEQQAKAWARFLHGLDWDTIKPLVTMAASTHAHPALAAGVVIRTTKDDTIKATLLHHLETKSRQDPGTPCPYCSNPEGWDACPAHRDGALDHTTPGRHEDTTT